MAKINCIKDGIKKEVTSPSGGLVTFSQGREVY